MKIKCRDFNLDATLESGQVFGFSKSSDRFKGVLQGHEVELHQDGPTLHVKNGKSPLRENIVRNYFDLDRDLGPLFEVLGNEPIRPSVDAFRGLRLIRQDPWEALACFILSSNNNVKRIQLIYRNITAHYAGFPAPAQIARTHERTLRSLGLGYRAPFLQRTAQFLSTNPHYLESVRETEYGEARERIMAFPGIGPKVADCALLYGFHRLDAFPVDVWILRIMRKIYFRNRRVSESRVHAFGRRRWGPLAGYVQQYLFHGARNGLI